MKRLLLPSTAFIRSSRRFARKHPQLAPELRLTIELLAEDAFLPQLKTHKLKGRLASSWACSAGYDARRLSIRKIQGTGRHFAGMGTHDEVYWASHIESAFVRVNA